jgi:hypothetical protein
MGTRIVTATLGDTMPATSAVTDLSKGLRVTVQHIFDQTVAIGSLYRHTVHNEWGDFVHTDPRDAAAPVAETQRLIDNLMGDEVISTLHGQQPAVPPAVRAAYDKLLAAAHGAKGALGAVDVKWEHHATGGFAGASWDAVSDEGRAQAVAAVNVLASAADEFRRAAG